MTQSNSLTVREAAAFAKVSRETIFKACRNGRLEHTNFGGSRGIVMSKKDVNAWINEGFPTSPKEDDNAEA